MKKFVIFFLVTFSSFLISLVGDTNSGKQKGESQLFLIQAKSASLRAKEKNAYELTLYDVNHFVFHFADRPNRAQGLTSLKQFLKTWNRGSNSFQKDNPNAGLEGITVMRLGEHQQMMLAVQISDPIYDEKMGSLTFQVRILDKKNMPSLPCNIIIEPTLFIDSECWYCGASV